jgi:type I restriction enzyme, S subunit
MTLSSLAALGEVALLNPSKSGALASADDEVDFFPMAVVEASSSTAASTERRRYHEVQKGYTSFADGDVLLAKITPCFENGKIAQARVTTGVAFGSTEFHVLRPGPSLDGRYLVHFLRRDQVRIDGARKMTGSAGQRRVPKHFLESLPIPIPPLPEQRRVAAILDQADALRAKRREALAQLESLAQSVFVEMFGDPEAYEQKPLKELCDLITDGTHQTPTYASDGVAFLSAKNVTSGEIDWEDIKFIPQSLHLELHRRLAPRRGDILLAKNGTTGVAAVVDRDSIFDIYVSLALLRPKADVLSTYLHAAINSPLCTRQFASALKGIGVPNLHLKEIRQTTIPYPPTAAQEDFARRMAALSDLKASTRSSLTGTEALFKALQHRAFRGEL